MSRPQHRSWLSGSVLLLLLLPALGAAQEVETRGGDVHRGHTFPAGQELRLNPYGSTAAAMTLGERRLRVRDVLEVREEATSTGFFRQLDTLRPGDRDAHIALLRWSQTRRLRPMVQRAAAEVLRIDGGNAEALKAIKGVQKFEALRRSHLELDPRRQQALRTLIRLENGQARKTGASRFPNPSSLSAHYVERMAASLYRDRGLVSEVPLELGAAGFPGATYDRFVPADYDPVVPRPLLIALHGGGIRNAKGTPVVGSGRDAMALFRPGAERAGFILVAPSAVEAPWPNSSNEAFVELVIEQVLARWNIDLERIHLVGQGGGGDGVWHIASRGADRFASVGVAAAGDPKAYTAIASRTALWMYHGAEDEIVPVEPVRKAAERLLKSKADFVYCELPDERHGFAPAAEKDWFHFAGPRRRRKAKVAFARSSFALEPSKAEIAALGHPGGGWGIGLPAGLTVAELLARMAVGRYDSEPAARILAQRGLSEEERGTLRAMVQGQASSLVGRAWGAWLLGRLTDKASLGVLGDILRAESDSRLLRHAADAVARFASRDSVEDLRFALLSVAQRYRALKGQTVPWIEFERACRLGAALAVAMARVGKAADVQADLEESLVIGILRDRRRVVFRMGAGEDKGAMVALLTESIARAYKTLGVDSTLYDMLRAVVKREPRALQALARGRSQGVRPPR